MHGTGQRCKRAFNKVPEEKNKVSRRVSSPFEKGEGGFRGEQERVSESETTNKRETEIEIETEIQIEGGRERTSRIGKIPRDRKCRKENTEGC